MAEPSLPELEALRDRLYAQLAAVGDFRRGSVTENYRKCGKPNCACAQPGQPGHGPRFPGPGRGGREGAPGDRAPRGVHGPQRADRRGEREDLRGPAGGPSDTGGICRAARVFPLAGTKKDELGTALGYFENNARRMRCKWFWSRGLFARLSGAGSVRPVDNLTSHAGPWWPY